MDEIAKRKALRAYFTPARPGGAIFLMLLGSVVLVHSPAVGLFVIIIGVAWLIILLAARGRVPTDNEVDAWFDDDVAKITEQSINKLGLEGLLTEHDPKPLRIRGPILWSTTGVPNKELLWRRGKDRTVRFAIYRVTVIHLADHVLAAYSCDFNFLRNVALNERTDEYHYKDIVSVSTQEVATSYTLPTGIKLVKMQAFRLS